MRCYPFRFRGRSVGAGDRRRRAWLASLVLLGFAPGSAIAGLSLTGSLLLVQEGPVASKAGDPVPANLALNGVAFGSSELGPELGIGYHLIDNLNDGSYGNNYSWIGGDITDFVDAFAGIDLGAVPLSNIQSVAFGRSNVLTGDPCGPVCTDRHLGLYSLQYTQVPSPSGNLDLDVAQDPLAGWVDIGTLEYGDSDGVGTNYNRTWQRHRYNFDPVSATGLRLVVPGTGIGGGTAIDEFEIYDVAGAFVPPPPPPPPFAISAAEGYQIAWDGNDGDYFDPEAPPDGSLVPDNLALASNGAIPFTSSDLGPEIGVPFHSVENINDGYYGNANSWIGGGSNPHSPVQFAGVNLGDATTIGKIAWGRDNGNDTTDACGGQCTDRWAGEYSIQYTNVAQPDSDTPDTGDAATGWETVGTVSYQLADPAFTPYWRHEFEIGTAAGNGLLATGVRLLVPTTGLAGGTAIDELEIYAGNNVQVPGDLDGNGVFDVKDIDELAAAIRAASTDARYDLNNDSQVSIDDHTYLIKNIRSTWIGDANLDGEFNSSDFVTVFQIGEYEDAIDGNSGWGEGDWNADGDFTSGDFVAAFQDGGFEQGQRAATSAVPEPASCMGILWGLAGICGGRMRKRRSVEEV